jgi:GT2 family glycosyltransferase
MKITAVVVTYNRLELLKKSIDCLRKINELDEILIINNGSTDGTEQWLALQSDIKTITQKNVGGSGGFHKGIETAYNNGADWIWCMDDDVFPRPNSLCELLKHISDRSVGILAPRRLMEGKPFVHEFREYNFSNPLASMKKGKLAKEDITTVTDIAGTDFEGPFISREVVEKIGLPNKDFFIFCDDTDYCLRAYLGGFKLKYVPTAILDKHKFFTNDSWSSRNIKKKWKRFYQIRNTAYMNKTYGRNFGTKYIRSIIGLAGYVIPAIILIPFSKVWSLEDVSKLIRAYKDGINGVLGKLEN